MSEKWDKFLGRLCERLRKLASTVESSDPYGTDDANEGPWCEDCGPESAWNLNNGWTMNWDGQEFCDKCGKILDHFFTDYGVENEVIDAADDEGPINPEEAYTLLNCIDSGVPKLTGKCGDWESSPELKPHIRAIAKRLRMRAPREEKTV